MSLLERIAAEETDPAVFHAQLEKIRALMPLAAKRVLVLVGKVLEQHGLQVTPTADH